MKFRIEDIVLPSERQVAKLFECPICLCVLHDPVQTKCEHHFCAECIPRKHGVCPVCKSANEVSDIKRLKDANGPMHRMMGKITVTCPYRKPARRDAASSSSSTAVDVAEEPAPKRRGAVERCSWTGSYSDLLEVHLEQCPSAPVPCPHCKAEFPRAELRSHEETCELRHPPCPICGVRMRDEEEHMASAAAQHVAILQSRLEDAKSARQAQAACVSTLATLGAQIRDLNGQAEELSRRVARCAEKHDVTTMIGELKASKSPYPCMGETFQLSIQAFSRLQQRYPIDEFWAAPIHATMPFQVRLYPQGVTGGTPGSYGVYVKAVGLHPAMTYSVKVDIGKESATLPGITTTVSVGRTSFGAIAQLEAAAAKNGTMLRFPHYVTHGHSALTSFSVSDILSHVWQTFTGSSDAEIEDDDVAGKCQPDHPALLPKVSCPGVGPEVAKARLEGTAICGPQPPAACESARRAEWAVKELQRMIASNPMLRWLEMSAVPLPALWVAASAPAFAARSFKPCRQRRVAAESYAPAPHAYKVVRAASPQPARSVGVSRAPALGDAFL